MKYPTLTTAQLRHNELIKLNDSYIHDINKANYINNCYYRLCALSTRLLELDNDYYTANLSYTQDLHKKEERMIDRLNNTLSAYGLKLVWFSFRPSICKDDNYTVFNYYPY